MFYATPAFWKNKLERLSDCLFKWSFFFSFLLMASINISRVKNGVNSLLRAAERENWALARLGILN
jgi:hypothetical protein